MQGPLAMGLFIDLSKTYDCVDRRVLLNKLGMLGIGTNILQLLTYTGTLDSRKLR